MPGHVKLGSSNEPDPDPLPYLVVPMDVKRADMSKPYDAKKSVWVPNDSGGFVEAMLDSEAGGKSTVMVGHEVSGESIELLSGGNTYLSYEMISEKGVQERACGPDQPAQV